jgi:hypothetical protein
LRDLQAFAVRTALAGRGEFAAAGCFDRPPGFKTSEDAGSVTAADDGPARCLGVPRLNCFAMSHRHVVLRTERGIANQLGTPRACLQQLPRPARLLQAPGAAGAFFGCAFGAFISDRHLKLVGCTVLPCTGAAGGTVQLRYSPLESSGTEWSGRTGLIGADRR